MDYQLVVALQLFVSERKLSVLHAVFYFHAVEFHTENSVTFFGLNGVRVAFALFERSDLTVFDGKLAALAFDAGKHRFVGCFIRIDHRDHVRREARNRCNDTELRYDAGNFFDDIHAAALVLAVEELEGNAFVFRTVAFGKPERDFNVTSLGYGRIFSADLQRNIVRFALFNVACIDVDIAVAGDFVKHVVNGFVIGFFRNEHHLASFVLGEGALSVFVFEIHFRKVGVGDERRLCAAIDPKSAVVIETGGASQI